LKWLTERIFSFIFSTDRTTERDDKIASELITQFEKSGFDRVSFYNALHSAKVDKSSLTTSQLLRSDFKHYAMSDLSVGISSMPVGIQSIMNSDIQEFCANSSIKFDVFMVMSAFHGPKFRRQLLLAGDSEELLNKIVSGLSEGGSEAILQPTEIQGGVQKSDKTSRFPNYFLRLEQGNLKTSRKILQPALAKVLEQQISD